MVIADPPDDGFSTLADMLRRRADDEPDRRTYSFLLDGEAAEDGVTNAELDGRARAIAAMLAERRLRGERVLLLYPPGLDLIAAVFGCLYAGTVGVLAYPPDPTRIARTLPRLMSIAADAAPSALLTSSAFAGLKELAFGGAHEIAALPWLTTDDVDPARAATWHDPGVRGDDVALLQYTSGSTAEPRGVVLTHACVLDNLRRIRSSFGITRDAHTVLWLPPYHDMGLIGGIFETIEAGMRVTLMSPAAFLQRPARWLRAISRAGATISGGPNFAYDLCARKITPDELDGVDLSGLEVMFTGAETVSPDTLRRFAQAFGPWGFRAESYLPCYGLAEASLIVSGGRLSAGSLRRHLSAAGTADATARFVSCGPPIDGHRTVVVDPARRTPCAPGEAGEIWLAGPSVAAGYWNRPRESARTFAATLADGQGPFLRTGDLGFVRDGELHPTARLKDLIVIRGRNIYPQDVERTVDRCHPALRPGAGAAFGVPVGGAERLVVVQEAGEGSTPPDEVAATVRTAVSAAHGVTPYAVTLIAPRSIPKTSSGKIQRGRAREAFLAGTLSVLAEFRDRSDEVRASGRDLATRNGHHAVGGRGSTGHAPPSTERAPRTRQGIEDWLVAEIARVSGVDSAEIGVGDPFVVLGLDSVTGVALAGDLQELLGVPLPETLTWDYPSISELAGHLAEVVAGSGRPAVKGD